MTGIRVPPTERRAGSALFWVGAALLAWLAVKLGVVILLGYWGRQPLVDLSQFDAHWYRSVVEGGYQWPGTGTSPLSNLSFFPLLPAVADVLTMLGLRPQTALILVNSLGSAAAVVGMQRIGAHLYSERAGFWLAFLWAVAPRAHTQIMGYSEGVFTALVAWSLYLLLTKRPLTAGLLAGLAGLTRPAVVPLILVFCVVWVLGIRRRWSKGPIRAILSRDLAAAVLSGLGFLGYWLYVAWRTGSFFGYFDVQAAWKASLGTPLDTVRFVLDSVLPHPELWRMRGAIFAVMLIYLALFVWMVLARVDWRLTLFVGAGLLLVLSQQGYFHANARFLLPYFPAWLPLAGVLARAPRWVTWPVALLVAAVAIAWGADTAVQRWSP